ncbi:MAG TPA: MFS transporter [Elusimicrobiota bacterium]|nr:MFS transporter [Elusimicrobiota bacterium]
MTKSTRSALLAIFLIVAVDILGLTIVLPMLPFYAEHYGASPQVVGLLATVFAFCAFLSGPVLGRWSDRFGRRPVLMASQIGTFIGFIILAKAQALWVIFLSRIVDGITAGNLSIAQAFISDVTEPENRAKAFGVIGIAFGLGFFIGPAISAYLSQYGFSHPAWAAAGLSFTSILCTYFLLPDTRHLHHAAAAEEPMTVEEGNIFHFHRFFHYMRRPGVSETLWQFLFFGLGFSCLISGFPLFAERRFTAHGHPFGTREVGYFYTYIGFLGMIIQGFILGKIVKRLGETRLVGVGFLMQGLGYAGLAFVYRWPWLLVTSAVSSFGSGVLRPALTSLLTQRASRREQGAVLGTSQSLMSVSQITAPLLSGFLINQAWLNAWALSAAGFSLVGLGLAVPMFARSLSARR